MVKPPIPLKIVDPSHNHVITVHPNQDFVITLSDKFSDVVVVDSQSYFFKNILEVREDGCLKYIFRQNEDYTQWGMISKVFLGNIIIVSRFDAITLSVFLDTQNRYKVNSIAIINPKGHEISIEKDKILEVVVFNEDLGKNDKWESICITGDNSICMEQLNEEIITPDDSTYDEFIEFIKDASDYNDAYCVFPRSKMCREHHFWFKYSDSSLEYIDNMESGVYNGGKIVFDGCSSDGSMKSMFNVLNLVLNVKNIKETIQQTSCLYKREINLKIKQCDSLDSYAKVVHYKL